MKMFPLFEITMLSMCSKRTRAWIKAFRIRRNALEIKMELNEEETVYLYNESEKEYLRFNITFPMSQETRELVKIGDLVCQMSIEETKEDEYEKYTVYSINMCMKDRIEGLKVLSEYLCSVFEIHISDFCITSHLNPNDQISIMDWVTKKGLPRLGICFNKTNITAAERLLSKVNQADDVFITFRDFKTPDFKTSFKFERHDITLKQCNWFSLDNLLNINSSKLHVNESKLTNKEMNSFLKHWMSSDLKFGKVAISMVEEVRIDDLFNEIPFEERTNDVERVFQDFYGPRTISGGYDIKRNDGMIATIVDDRLSRKELFVMIVWDKQ
uniref:FBA_2 domain-containing protein n=1 Tax=Caenorhabditis tropicalis TaxID=1561998 RepID=A0A1I7THZ2_9PELO